MKKEKEFRCLFGHNIISNGLYRAFRNKYIHSSKDERSFDFILHKSINDSILMSDKTCHINKERFSKLNDFCNDNQYEITDVKKFSINSGNFTYIMI